MFTKQYVWLFAFLVLLSSVSAQTVIVNSYEWQDIQLGAAYAGQQDNNILHFLNLGDAQIKTQTLQKNADIIIFESTSRPVVKNYESLLQVNGYSNFEVILFEDFTELQEILTQRTQATKFIITDSTFGVQAITSTPIAVGQDFQTLYVTPDNVDDVAQLTRGAEEIKIVGKLPIRILSKFDVTENNILETDAEIITRYLDSYTQNWGVLQKSDAVDPQSLRNDRPIFLYFGDAAKTGLLIKNSGITNFEVIGPEMADIAAAIEEEAEIDLKYLLKYGRTVTQIPGLEGEILEVDTILVDYPFVSVTVESITYYEQIGKLAVTYRNRGNVPALIFSNIEFGQIALADDQTQVIPPGSTITLGYDADAFTSEATLNTRYGQQLPLDSAIVGEQGTPFITLGVSQGSHPVAGTVEISKVELDDELGELIVHVTANGQARAQLQYDNQTIVASSTQDINGKGILRIPVPYLSADELVGKILPLTVFNGAEQTVFTVEIESEIFKKVGTTGILLIAGVILIILIILIVVLIIWRRRY